MLGLQMRSGARDLLEQSKRSREALELAAAELEETVTRIEMVEDRRKNPDDTCEGERRKPHLREASGG